MKLVSQSARETLERYRLLSAFLKTVGFLLIVFSGNQMELKVIAGVIFMLLAWYVYDFGLYMYNKRSASMTITVSSNAGIDD